MNPYPASYWIDRLHLQPHPEGGYFSESYRSAESIQFDALPTRFSGGRSLGTAIYFLLQDRQTSAFHRIQSDEIWHFYAGNSLHVAMIDASGSLETICLGSDAEAGEVFQAVVPAGRWFGSYLPKSEGYALVGCTVAPGFDFADFELASRDSLLALLPQHQDIIERLTSPSSNETA